MKSSKKALISLTVICAVVAILLSGVNLFTAPIIAENERIATEKAMLAVLPDGEGFTPVTPEKDLPASVKEIYSDVNGGYVFKIKTAGYAAGLVLMIGINADGSVAGATVIASSETLGAENGYGDAFQGATSDTVNAVDTVSGATRTTEAYKNAVKNALTAFSLLSSDDGV